MVKTLVINSVDCGCRFELEFVHIMQNVVPVPNLSLRALQQWGLNWWFLFFQTGNFKLEAASCLRFREE